MSATGALTLKKEERLCSLKLIDRLFKGSGSRSMSAFPLRMVYAVIDSDSTAEGVQMLVSVPKRHFKRAVKRNRVKRQVREAYRKHKHTLLTLAAGTPGRVVTIAFIWQCDELYPSEEVEAKVEGLIARLCEKLGTE